MQGKSYEQQGTAVTCRSLEEYMAMFDLNAGDLADGEIADVAAGASSFAAEARAVGCRAVAYDPRYVKGMEEWHQEALAEIGISTAKLQGLAPLFDWTYYGSLDQHREGRLAALERSTYDRSLPGSEERYVAASLPQLPVDSGRFKLVLCSHFLFLYAQSFGSEFHRQSLLELMRITAPGGRVLVYPLISLSWEKHSDMDDLMEAVAAAGGSPSLRDSRLPFIPGSEQFLEIQIPFR